MHFKLNAMIFLVGSLLLSCLYAENAGKTFIDKLVGAVAPAPDGAKIKPSLLTNEDENGYTAAIAFKYDAGSKLHGSQLFGWDRYYNIKSQGTIAADSDFNSENLFLEAKLGLRCQSGHSTYVRPATPQRPDASNTMPSGNQQQDFRPFFHLSGVARYETDQTLDNQNLVFGPMLYSTNTATVSKYAALYPYWGISLTWVEVLKSEDFEERGIDEEGFWRFQAELEWDFQLGQYFNGLPEWAQGIGFIPRIVYYHAYELPDGANEAGFDEDFSSLERYMQIWKSMI